MSLDMSVASGCLIFPGQVTDPGVIKMHRKDVHSRAYHKAYGYAQRALGMDAARAKA